MSEIDVIHIYIHGTNGRVLLLLHGTGGDENQLLPLARELDPAASILSVRGRVSEHGANRFFRRFAEGVFDEEDVARRAQELANFIIAATIRYQFEPAQLTAVGYSNGANVAAAVMLLRPDALKSAVLLRPMIPLTDCVLPDLSGHRILVRPGVTDTVIPPEEGGRLAALLERAGASTTLEMAQAGHNLIGSDVVETRAWLEQ